MNEMMINRATDQITHYSGGRDPFESLANDVAPRDMIGRPLRFVKGDYILGRDDEENVPIGTTMIAIMPLLLHGWVRWQDSKPADKIYARVALGERAPERKTLGDNDPALWEHDKFGNSRDPWAESMLLPLIRTDDDFACTFQTSSYGGRKALGELARAYAKGRKRGQPDLPLIELRSHTRQTQNYGPIKEPRFELVGWESREKHLGALDTAGILELLGEEPPPLPPAGHAFAPNARARQAMAGEMNDEIPF